MALFAHNKRSGLIPTMIENGIKKKVSMISGSLNTLRDYVHAEDIVFFSLLIKYLIQLQI